MSKVTLSPLLRAMLKDEKARQQLSDALGDNSVGGKVEFGGKVYRVESGEGGKKACECSCGCRSAASVHDEFGRWMCSYCHHGV